MSQDFFYPPGSSNVITVVPSGTQDVNLIRVGGVAISEGQKAMAASLPVVIASDQSTLAVSAASLPLPAGASTSALQTSGNSSLTSIDGKLNSLGQKAMAASVPVVIASDQSAVPVSGTVAVSNFPATQPVSGTVAVSNFPATQPVSGTVAVSNFPATQPISAATLPLPSGASTSANQATEIASLASIDGKLNSLGQKAMAASMPVVIASDQSAVPVSGTVSANATPVTTSGTVTQAAVTVGTSAVRCTVSGSAPNAARKALIVEPDPASTAKFYIGSSSVTSSGATRGISLSPGSQFIADFDASDFYIISDTAAQTFFVVEEV